jgi:hypothetical protein
LLGLRAVSWDDDAAGRPVDGGDRVALVDGQGFRQELAIGDAPRDADGARPARVSTAERPFWLDVRPMGDILARLDSMLAGRQ